MTLAIKKENKSMKKIKNLIIDKFFYRLRIKSAQNRVVVVCVCFMLISMLIIGVYSYATIYSKLFKQQSEEMQIYSQKTVDNLEQVFSFAYNTGMAVATSESIMQWVDNPSVFNKNEKNFYNKLYQLKDEIMHILAYSNAWKNDYISFISVFVNDEMLIYSASKPMAESAINKSAYKVYKTAKDLQDGQLKNNFLIQDNYIYHIRTMKHIYEREESLAIMIALDEKSLRKQYGEDDSGKSYLINQDGIIFSSSDENACGKKCSDALWKAVKDKQSEVYVNGTTYVCETVPLTGLDLVFLNLIPKSEIMSRAFAGMPTYISIACILCILLLGIGILISYRSTRFIRDLADGMEEIKHKNYEVKMPHYQNEAIDYLSDSFNSMTEAMKILVRDTYEAKIMLQEIQLEFLQQQVNPHFLFNILLTIQVKAKMCSDESIYHMLEALSGFLRAGLYVSQNIFTTLGEELKFVQFYLYLQQQRFEDKLCYKIEVPDEFMDMEIPRLSIEPMVENAVVHGAEETENMVTVKIKAEETEEDLEIIIEDDGCGFSVESLHLDEKDENVNLHLEHTSRDKIGVRNTNSRLKLLYGEKYKLQILSSKGQGTKVIMKVPKTEKMGDRHVPNSDCR